jgi:hypothetical protein
MKMTKKLTSALLLFSSIFGVKASDDAISTDWTCYDIGENVKMSFTTLQPTHQNWVGIYKADVLDPSTSRALPVNYMWSCGSLNPECKQPGFLTFKFDSSPLGPGVYKAYMRGIGVHGHSVSVESEIFTIKKSEEKCNCEDVVFTEKSSYHVGEEILVAFEASSPEENNWIGIYPAGADPSNLDPIRWLWACGDQRCVGEIGHDILSFGTYKLEEGEYTAVFGQRVPGGSILTIAQSDPFTINLAPASECETLIRTKNECYIEGDEIVAYFRRCNAKDSDLISIFPYDADLNHVDGFSNAWALSSVDTNDISEVNLSSTPDYLDDPLTFPLTAGKYMAVILRKNSGGPLFAPHASEPFTVKPSGERCSASRLRSRSNVSEIE